MDLVVFYCCSEMFAEVCAVSVISLFENNKHTDSITVYIVEEHMSDLSKQRFQSMAEQYGRDIRFVPMPDPSEFYGDKRFTIESLGHTWTRMAVADLLPESVDRVLCLDSDTIVLDAIDELWNADLKPHGIGGVDECLGRDTIKWSYRLPEDARMCCGGFFLIDLSQWHKENWTDCIKKYIKDTFDAGMHLNGFEEQVFNVIFLNKKVILPLNYFVGTMEEILSYDEILRHRDPFRYYTVEEYASAREHPIICHACASFYVKKRIYEMDSDHPRSSDYKKYRKLTPWSSDPQIQRRTTFLGYLSKSVWHWMPRGIAFMLAGFVRNKVITRLKIKRDDLKRI